MATSVTIYNVPVTADEDELHMIFPSAQRVQMCRNQSYPGSSQNTCVLQFSSANECYKAFAECQQGKELGGRMLHAVLGDDVGQNTQPSVQQSDRFREEPYSSNKPYTTENTGERSSSRGRVHGDDRYNDDAILVVSNLPYSTTERDLEKEFRDACNITLNRDDRGRSSGVAHLSFRTREQCDAALHACNNKTLNGRALRGRITFGHDSGNAQRHHGNGSGQGRYESGNAQRNYNNRSNYGRMDSGNMQRNYENRSGAQGRANSGNMHTNYDNRPGQGRMDSGNTQRNYDNRSGQQSNYNSNRRDFDDSRRGRGGGRGFGDGARDFNRGRSDRYGARRERSPTQGEPVRGYAASKGFRITSAVIQGARSPSSSSSSDED